MNRGTLSSKNHTSRGINGLMIAMVLLVFFSTTLPAHGGDAEILIIHTNDFHGQLLPFIDKSIAPPPDQVGGAAFIAAHIKRLRASLSPSKVLLLDSGDIAQGSPISNLNQGKPVVEYMNYLGYDAMALGNHEFDWGIPALKKMLMKARFPVLCANLRDEKTGKIPSFTRPYALVERDGVKIGIIGVISPHTPFMINPRYIEGFSFLDPEEPVKMYIDELQRKGAQVICLLSHLGVREDRLLAGKVKGISLIVGGHSHTALEKTEKIDDTLVVQAGYNGKYLGHLRLAIDRETGTIRSYNGEHELIPILDREIEPDKNVEALIKPYYEKVRPLMSEVVGCAEGDLINRPQQGYVDTPLGNVVTDAVRTTYGADLAVYNTEGIRNPLYKGNITRGDIFNVLPFDNDIVTLDLTGEQVLQAVEFFIANPHYVQVSGITFTFYPKREKGKKIGNVSIGGIPLEKEKIYKFGTVDFLLYTTGDFDVLRKGKNLSYGKLARDVLEDYVRKENTVAPPSENRIKVEEEK